MTENRVHDFIRAKVDELARDVVPETFLQDFMGLALRDQLLGLAIFAKLTQDNPRILIFTEAALEVLDDPAAAQDPIIFVLDEIAQVFSEIGKRLINWDVLDPATGYNVRIYCYSFTHEALREIAERLARLSVGIKAWSIDAKKDELIRVYFMIEQTGRTAAGSRN